MNKYLLHGALSAKGVKANDLAEILLEASQLVSTAKGCSLYVISTDGSDKVFGTEIWDSKEDHDNSLSIPGVREFIGKAVPLLEGQPEKGQELNLLGGFGI